MYYDLSNMTFFQKIKFWLFGLRMMYRAYICATRFDCSSQYCKYYDDMCINCPACRSAFVMEMAEKWNIEYVTHGGKYRPSVSKEDNCGES